MDYVIERLHAHQSAVLWLSIGLMVTVIGYALVEAFNRVV